MNIGNVYESHDNGMAESSLASLYNDVQCWTKVLLYGVELSDGSRRQQFVQSEEIKWMWKEMAWYVSEFRKTRYCASFDVVM